MGRPAKPPRRLSRAEAIARIASALERNLALGEEMARNAALVSSGIAARPSAPPDGYALAVELALAFSFQKQPEKAEDARIELGKLIAKAEKRLEDAIAAGRLTPAADGTMSATEVKKVVLRSAGRGTSPFYERDAVERLVGFILANPAIPDVELARRKDLALPYANIQESGAGTNCVSTHFAAFRKFCVSAARARLTRFRPETAAPDDDRQGVWLGAWRGEFPEMVDGAPLPRPDPATLDNWEAHLVDWETPPKKRSQRRH